MVNTLVASRKYAKSCLCAHLTMFLCKNLNERAHAQLSTRAGTFFRVEFKLDTVAVKLVIFSASCKSVLQFFYLGNIFSELFSPGFCTVAQDSRVSSGAQLENHPAGMVQATVNDNIVTFTGVWAIYK